MSDQKQEWFRTMIDDHFVRGSLATLQTAQYLSNLSDNFKEPTRHLLGELLTVHPWSQASIFFLGEARGIFASESDGVISLGVPLSVFPGHSGRVHTSSAHEAIAAVCEMLHNVLDILRTETFRPGDPHIAAFLAQFGDVLDWHKLEDPAVMTRMLEEGQKWETTPSPHVLNRGLSGLDFIDAPAPAPVRIEDLPIRTAFFYPDHRFTKCRPSRIASVEEEFGRVLHQGDVSLGNQEAGVIAGFEDSGNAFLYIRAILDVADLSLLRVTAERELFRILARHCDSHAYADELLTEAHDSLNICQRTLRFYKRFDVDAITRVPPSSGHDGPGELAPDFWWKGKPVRITPTSWHIARAAWNRDVPFLDIVDEVPQWHGSTPVGTIRRAVHDLNQQLLEQGVSVSFRTELERVARDR